MSERKLLTFVKTLAPVRLEMLLREPLFERDLDRDTAGRVRAEEDEELIFETFFVTGI